MWIERWALTLAVVVPLVGAGVVALLPREREALAKGMGVVVSGVALLFGLLALTRYDFSLGGMQLELKLPWIRTVGASYHVGVDGISLPLFVLTLLLTFLCAVYTLRWMPEGGSAKAFTALVLLLETGMAGTFIALDLILFFVFWELVLVPMYFLIAIWGMENRVYAAIKFFLYTVFGSVFMLLGFLALYFRASPHTFDVVELVRMGSSGAFPRAFQNLVFLGLFLGFAIKVPMWPFHTWLPDAHTEAPTVGSVLLAGILLKMGTYGFVRLALPILPEASRDWAPLIGVLAAIAIVYGALCCLAQRDLKRLIAFSSVGHMGFVMLGISTLSRVGVNAAVYGMVAHGVITGMLFFLAGSIKDRYHVREIQEIGGGMLAKLPYLGGVLAYAAIASLGLPGLAGFWGEVFSLLAAFNPAPGLPLGLYRGLAVAGAVGTVLTAGYFLWMLQRVNLGSVPERWIAKPMPDVVLTEWVAWAPLLVLILALGVYPVLVFGVTNPAVTTFLALGR